MCDPFGTRRAAAQSRALAQQARNEEIERQNRIREGTERINVTFGQFDEPFFQRRAELVTNFYLPQLDEQYRRAREGLLFALANAGTLGSSVATRSLGDMERDYARQRQDIIARGQQEAQQARAQLEEARAGVLRNLMATGDATGASAEAVGRARMLAIDPSFSPLSQVFANTAAGIGLGAREAEDAAWYAARRRATATSGITPGQGGSDRVVR